MIGGWVEARKADAEGNGHQIFKRLNISGSISEVICPYQSHLLQDCS